jgi:hypothetical protein
MAAFRAAFSDIKLVKTRQVAQLIFEIPLSDFDAAYEVLGGMPNPANERWFGIAAIKQEASPAPRPERLQTIPQPDGAKRDWRDLQPAQQAGIRCGEATFGAFLKETRPDDWHEASEPADCVRLICGVNSRVQLGTEQKARVIWHQLDSEYQAWLAKERVSA